LALSLAPLSLVCGDKRFTSVSVDQAEKLISADSTVVLLDVRTTAEWNSSTGHLAKALLIPVQELEQRINELVSYKSQTILVYCRTGHRSASASSILAKAGYAATNMEGGITKWNEMKYPVVIETKE
jgi:rhodanese-related sulfurtransferase